MSPLDPVVVEVEPSGESDPQPDRRPPPCWPPRPATIVAALFVGSSLFFMNLIDADFVMNLSEQYGWPFRYHFSAPDHPAFIGGASTSQRWRPISSSRPPCWPRPA